MRKNLIETKNLWVHYGKAEALRNVSLSIPEGSIVALLGANGAGKTTTLRTISGLKRPTSGEIFFDNKRIDMLPPHEIVKLGIAHVPEGRQLFYSLTVLQNLQMGGYFLKGKREFQKKLETILEHFPQLKDKLERRATDLSGGEQQMVAVARALMSDPKVLLMDEPSLGLSPIMVREVEKIIKEINRKGVTVLLVEQNAHMALELADLAYILEVGTVSLSGDAKSLAKDERVIKAYLGGD